MEQPNLMRTMFRRRWGTRRKERAAIDTSKLGLGSQCLQPATACQQQTRPGRSPRNGTKVVLFANTDWYLWNFRRPLAVALKDAGYDVLMLSPAGKYAPMFAQLGLRWRPFQMDRRSLNPVREFGVLWRLVRLFRRERPTLVHGFTIKCAVYGALAARIAGLRARVNAVGGMGYLFSSSDLKAKLFRPPVRALMRLAFAGEGGRLILQNPDDVALFERAKLAEKEHIRLIRSSGVDCLQFKPNANPDTGTVRILLAARLLWDKGIAEYAAAARALRSRFPHARFLLAGATDPGNPAAVPESEVRACADQNALQWLRHVDDMATLFASVDIVVLPSYREGTPKSLIEAGASGKALVTSDVPGCREVVTDGVDGLLVPARDADALGCAIAQLIEAPELRERLGRAARTKALTEFDVRIVNAATMAVYDEVLGHALQS